MPTGDTVDELKLIRDETIQLLKLGAFELSKVESRTALNLLEIDNHDRVLVIIRDNAADSCILGMQWNQCQDMFQFLCKLNTEAHVVSNEYFSRSLNCSILWSFWVRSLCKLILQDLWQLAIQWDESVPQDIHTRWITFRTQISDLNQLRIPQCVKLNAHQLIMEVHGFCDASAHSEPAYTKFGFNNHHSKLLCSKSCVAPFKIVSLPRLELSATLLLARLINKVRESLELSQCPIYLWSDSTIALNWITSLAAVINFYGK